MMTSAIVKTISNAFNTSNSFEEFLMRLDLLDISLKKAQEEYTECHKFWLKYKTNWYSNANIDFKKVYDEKNRTQMPIVLPFLVVKAMTPDTFTPKVFMKAMIDSTMLSVECVDLIDQYTAVSQDECAKHLVDSMLMQLANSVKNN